MTIHTYILKHWARRRMFKSIFITRFFFMSSDLCGFCSAIDFCVDSIEKKCQPGFGVTCLRVHRVSFLSAKPIF